MKKKGIMQKIHNDILRTVSFIAGCAVVLMAVDEEPETINYIVIGISVVWLMLFFHANADYFERRQMYSYFSTMRPVSIGTYPTNHKVLDVQNFSKAKQIDEINHHAWGIISFDEKLTEREQEMYELVPCDHPERYKGMH